MAITKIQAGALPADVITTAAIDDASITHAKLHTTMDLSSKTVTLPSLSQTIVNSSHIQMGGNLDVVGQIGAYDNPGSSWGKMILRATDFELKIAGGTIKMVLYTSGNVGIGTSSNFGKLSVNVAAGAPATSGNMTNGLTVHNTDGGRAIQLGINESGGYTFINSGYVNSAGNSQPMTFSTGGTERMRVHSSGNVGIGTDNPNYRLEVKGTATTNTDIIGFSNSNGTAKHIFGLENVGAGTYKLLDQSNNTAVFFSGHSSDDSYINAGNVGIGTNSPTAKLSVDQPSTTAISTTGGAAAGQIFTNEDFEFAFGLGNASPYPLYIQGRTSNPAISAARNLALQPIGGNVSIGTQSALDRLHVETASTQAHSTTLTKGTNTPGVWITNSNNDNNMSGLHLATSSGTHFSSIIGARTNNAAHWGTHLSFYTHDDNTSSINTATEKMRISGNGIVTMPRQPAWLAAGSGWLTTPTAGILPLGTVVTNIGNHYNAASAKFTAPVDGVYQVNTIFYMETVGQAVLKKNGADYAPVDTVLTGFTNEGANSELSSGSICIYLSAGDYIQLGARNGQTVRCYLGHTFFSGHLIG